VNVVEDLWAWPIGEVAGWPIDEQDLAALALTSRLVDSAVKPLSAREIWALRRTIEPTVSPGAPTLLITDGERSNSLL
jgi:hypothetical protein